MTEENYTDDALFAEDPPETHIDPDDVPAGDWTPEDLAKGARYGWMRDPKTRQMRPKNSPGRPHKPRGPEELAASDPPPPVAPDRPPTPKPPDKTGQGRTPPDTPEIPMPRGGVIAKAVNKAYRRAGRLIGAKDEDLGDAFIACTRPDPDDEDAPTVGEAWEAIAKANPRIRAWLMKLVDVGVWGDLAMAHAPIALALFMKPWVQRLIPFHTLIERWLEPDETAEPTELRPQDAADMHAEMMRQAEQMAKNMGGKVPPGVVKAAVAQAERQANGGASVPPGFRRAQPKRQTRASRKGK